MRFLNILTTVSVAALMSTSANALSLNDALNAAYENNPTLKAERKSMEASYENLPSAYSGFMPSLNANYTAGAERGNVNKGRDEVSHPRSYEMNLSQPLFRGGRTYNNIQQAEDLIKGATFGLQNAEQRVFIEAISAYLNVAQSREIYRLSKNNENVLKEQLNATNERFKLGETTKTDVAQSESRLASATSERITAHGNMLIAESEFRRIYQIEPEEGIAIPKNLPELPKNLEELKTLALSSDPALQQTYFRSESAKEAVDVATGTLLPTVSLEASTSKRSGGGAGSFDTADQDSLMMNVSVPLYQGGREYAELRRVRKSSQEASFRLDQERNNAINRATTSWEQLTTTKAAIQARQVSMESAQLALDGVKQEQEIGSRTVLDVLDAEQELFRSRVNLVTAQRDNVLAAYQVLASTGKLTAQGLALDVEKYDPQAQYDAVKYKVIGF